METKNVAANATNLCIDDGLEKIVISNRFGNEIGVLYFRPGDISIVDRYNEALSRLEAAVEPLRNGNMVPQNAGEEESAEAMMGALNEAKEKLFAAFDYLFDANVSEAFFSKVSPFSLAGGRFYCENVIEAVGSYIGKRVGVEVKQLNSRVEKYTHGYRHGKHKDGRK